MLQYVSFFTLLIVKFRYARGVGIRDRSSAFAKITRLFWDTSALALARGRRRVAYNPRASTRWSRC